MTGLHETTKFGRFWLKLRSANDLLLSVSYDGFRPFAIVFGFSWRYVTQNVTRRNALGVLLIGDLTRKLSRRFYTLRRFSRLAPPSRTP